MAEGDALIEIENVGGNKQKSYRESDVISKLSERTILVLIFISAALMIILYGRPVSDFYGSSSAIKKINISLSKYVTHTPKIVDQEEYFNSCLNELLSNGNIDLIEPSTINEEERQSLSKCNDAASRRGPHQRVVSFSFYGKVNQARNYFQGIEENAKLMVEIYPNWIMRVYHDIPPITQNISIIQSILNASYEATNSIVDRLHGLINSPQAKLCMLQHIYPYLDFCYVGNISGYGKLLGSQGNMWRFLPMADPLVDVFLSRDLDSRLNEREKAAVDDWLNSNSTFHIMRDHPYHQVHILAGMWGAATYREREKLANLTKQLMDRGKKYIKKNLDQISLKNLLWPAAKGIVMQHDSYHCKTFRSHGNMRPWPTERKNTSYNFVGARIGVDVKPMLRHCPSYCRPKDKQDWLMC